jgi:LPXTG-site transpeptidase (sortase) family protein
MQHTYETAADGSGLLRRATSRRAFLAGAAMTALLAACGGSKKNTNNKATNNNAVALPTGAALTPVQATPQLTPRATVALATPQATPTETPDDSGMLRLVIDKAGIDAPFVTLGVIAATNTMDSPKDKDHVGYYDFTPPATYGGNTVLSGHVDWYTGETGVFWNLKNLTKGDSLNIVMADNKTVRYRIADTQLYDDSDAPVDQIIGQTPVESVTMITCEGVFDRNAAEYNKRRVVRAERIYS